MATRRSLSGWLLGGLALLLVGVGTGAWLHWAPAPPAGDRISVTRTDGPAGPPTPSDTAQPKEASYQELLQGSASDDWRVVRLALNPKILIIEFPSLGMQAQTLNRLAALIEKNHAPRDRVLSDEGLASLIKQLGDTPETFYFGHDYPAEAVARFFTVAVHQQMLLNPHEMRLGNLLLFSKLLTEEKDRLVASEERQAVVTFTALQRDNPATAADETVDAQRRETILRHELSHGEFFTNAAYRQHCWSFWQTLSDEERRLFRDFLVKQDYDPSNEELMVNEAQAYLMHTPDPRAFNASLFGVSQTQLDALRSRFREGLPTSIFTTIDR